MFITKTLRVFLLVTLFTFGVGATHADAAHGASRKATRTAAAQMALPYTQGQVIDAINKARKAAGLPVLKKDDTLSRTAQAKADDMVKRRYFDHNTPTGVPFETPILSAGYDYQYVGENLAAEFSALDSLVRAWLASPSHRANIMDAHFAETGIGIARGERNGKKAWLVVQHFGTQF